MLVRNRLCSVAVWVRTYQKVERSAEVLSFHCRRWWPREARRASSHSCQRKYIHPSSPPLPLSLPLMTTYKQRASLIVSKAVSLLLVSPSFRVKHAARWNFLSKTCFLFSYRPSPSITHLFLSLLSLPLSLSPFLTILSKQLLLFSHLQASLKMSWWPLRWATHMTSSPPSHKDMIPMLVRAQWWYLEDRSKG